MRNHLVIFILSLFLNACVSVELPGSKVSSAKDVQLQEPAAPFKPIKSANADRAWQSEKSGNTISYLSECGNATDPSLLQLETDSLAAVSKMDIISTKVFDFNSRAGRSTTVSGEVDGVPIKLELLVFKKNGCNFTLSFGGVLKNFDSEQKYFEDFKNHFKAP